MFAKYSKFTNQDSLKKYRILNKIYVNLIFSCDYPISYLKINKFRNSNELQLIIKQIN